MPLPVVSGLLLGSQLQLAAGITTNQINVLDRVIIRMTSE